MIIDNDKQLWTDFIKGDSDAYASLYRIYVKRLYQYGLHYCNDTALIEDAIHDLFFKFYSGRTKLPEAPYNIRLYIFISFKNTLLNLLGKYNENFTLEINDYRSEFQSDENIENNIIKQEEEQKRSQQIKLFDTILTSRQKQAIYHKFIEQMSYKEVAEIMNINMQSAKNLVFSGIDKIRKVMPFHVFLVAMMEAIYSNFN